MKIAVINFSGNVGKTTIARHLLAPRLEGADVIPIESINADGAETEALRGRDFDVLQQQMMSLRSVVVDIGASNVEDFVLLMQRYEGSHEDFDRFIVPTVPALKQQVDTIATLNQLAELGIDPAKIRLVFNFVDNKSDVTKVFARLFDQYRAAGKFVLDPAGVVYENPIYEKIKSIGKTISEVNADPTDYVAWNARAMEDDTPEHERAHIRQMVAIKRLASRVTREHDAAFKLLVQ
ncbi:StbB [Paraburkholderia sp. Ac-20340]|uniref:StbB family protein n=1 Tax=Paraburkholderia sp. Ac-20340 TaxID=2703888 RepID=UPI00198134B6|nr:StbB family protein [Paraburkholderia sp. Ac-20340]MBN3856780.1 StbB [Paraburkholderia sp. Ac-20340]